MLSWLSRLTGGIKHLRVPFVASFERYLGSMRSSDKLIALTLGLLVVITSLVSLHALERMFLVLKPSHGGSLSEGVVGSPRFVNPLLALSETDRDLSVLTYGGLMGLGEKGALVPVLAESYEISEDGTTYTFRLRPEITFSDGTPLTADDIVFTVEKAQDPALKSPELANWANVRAEAVDARTVRFTLPKPYAPFLEDTTLGILPAHLWRGVGTEEFPFSTLMTNPVGAGAFTVANVHTSASGIIDRMTLKANSRFALGRPYLDSIRFTFFGQEKDLADAIKGGRIESGYGVIADTALAAPYSQVFGVFFNGNQNPLFTHAEVRKALSLATDRPAIVDSVFGGYASPLTGPVPPGSGLPVVEASTTTTEERLAAASKVLTDAGWALDAETGMWKQAKQKLELAVTLRTSNVPELKAVATTIKEQWGALHVPVVIELYEPGDLTQNVIRTRKYEALLFGMVVGRDTDLYAFWDSAERNDPGLNIAQYANKSVDDVLERMRGAATDERLTLLAKANDLIAADYPAVFAYTPDFVYAVPGALKGVALPQIAQPADRFAGVWGWYREYEEVWPVFKDADSR